MTFRTALLAMLVPAMTATATTAVTYGAGPAIHVGCSSFSVALMAIVIASFNRVTGRYPPPTAEDRKNLQDSNSIRTSLAQDLEAARKDYVELKKFSAALKSAQALGFEDWGTSWVEFHEFIFEFLQGKHREEFQRWLADRRSPGQERRLDTQ